MVSPKMPAIHSVGSTPNTQSWGLGEHTKKTHGRDLVHLVHRLSACHFRALGCQDWTKRHEDVTGPRSREVQMQGCMGHLQRPRWTTRYPHTTDDKPPLRKSPSSPPNTGSQLRLVRLTEPLEVNLLPPEPPGEHVRPPDRCEPFCVAPQPSALWLRWCKPQLPPWPWQPPTHNFSNAITHLQDLLFVPIFTLKLNFHAAVTKSTQPS